MKSHLIMTPGPTTIYDSVLDAMYTQGTNPDLDKAFFTKYKHIEMKYNELINGEGGISFFPTGEGILGLEFACVNLIEQGDKVLCISNGFFGAGFKDFIEFAGGMPIMLEMDWKRSITLEAVQDAVNKNPDIKVATMVHCETPSGVTNKIKKICQFLDEKGIISIVDSVSGIAGEQVDFDNYKIGCLLGGSQKCLSAPTGITMITFSNRAIHKIKSRKEAVKSYYFNAMSWLNRSKFDDFPYTQSVQLLLAFERAVEIAIKSDYVNSHKAYAQIVRDKFVSSGFTLYAEEDYSNTVTAVNLPHNILFEDLFNIMKNEHGILIGGGIGPLDGVVFRIGHMGANNMPENLNKLFKALKASFEKLGFCCDGLDDDIDEKALMEYDFHFLCE